MASRVGVRLTVLRHFNTTGGTTSDTITPNVKNVLKHLVRGEVLLDTLWAFFELALDHPLVLPPRYLHVGNTSHAYGPLVGMGIFRAVT